MKEQLMIDEAYHVLWEHIEAVGRKIRELYPRKGQPTVDEQIEDLRRWEKHSELAMRKMDRADPGLRRRIQAERADTQKMFERSFGPGDARRAILEAPDDQLNEFGLAAKKASEHGKKIDSGVSSPWYQYILDKEDS